MVQGAVLQHIQHQFVDLKSTGGNRGEQPAAGGLLNVGALVLAARTAPEWIPVAGLSGDLLATALTVGAHLRRRAADGPASPQMLS